MIKQTIFLVLILSLSCSKPEPAIPIQKLALKSSFQLASDKHEIIDFYQCIVSSQGIFLSDLIFNKKVFLFGFDGSLITTYGAFGQGPGEYQFAGSAIGNEHFVYVSGGNKALNKYHRDGSFIKKFSIQTVTPEIFPTLSEEGDLTYAVFSRYADQSIYTYNANGELTTSFSPTPLDFAGFDAFSPAGGLLRNKQDGTLIQFFNHRYELLIWSQAGNLIEKRKLASSWHSEPDYRKVKYLEGITEEKKFRATFTQFVGFHQLKDGWVSVLRTYKDDDVFQDSLEFWDADFNLKSRMNVAEDQRLIGVEPVGQRLIFFDSSEDSASILFFIVE